MSNVILKNVVKRFGAVTAVALVLAFFLTRSLSSPLREVIDASARVSAGSESRRVSRSGEPTARAKGAAESASGKFSPVQSTTLSSWLYTRLLVPK